MLYWVDPGTCIYLREKKTQPTNKRPPGPHLSPEEQFTVDSEFYYTRKTTTSHCTHTLASGSFVLKKKKSPLHEKPLSIYEL